jgi:hypothetical protein
VTNKCIHLHPKSKTENNDSVLLSDSAITTDNNNIKLQEMMKSNFYSTIIPAVALISKYYSKKESINGDDSICSLIRKRIACKPNYNEGISVFQIAIKNRQCQFEEIQKEDSNIMQGTPTK